MGWARGGDKEVDIGTGVPHRAILETKVKGERKQASCQVSSEDEEAQTRLKPVEFGLMWKAYCMQWEERVEAERLSFGCPDFS